jgi:phenylacetate-CoA ligase
VSAPATERATPQRWVPRGDLVATGLRPATAKGLLRVDPTASTALPLSADDLIAARALTAETLRNAGLQSSDRVVVALNNDGDLAGALLAEAAAEVAAAAASVGPRGRMRLLRTLESVRASVLVATPTGAADFLARLHLEFLVDPLDLELRLLVLTGEIADARTYAHLAKEFGATVVELWTDPVTSVPVAHRRPAESDELAETRPGLIHGIPLEPGGKPEGDWVELAVAHDWYAPLRGVGVRTGYVSQASEGVAAPRHTTGDLVLVRGRWLSIAALGKALRGIDGISTWELRIRREGTLDAATLTVSFNRESLVENQMWRGRLEQTLAALTPVTIVVAVAPAVLEEPRAATVVDERGIHLPG